MILCKIFLLEVVTDCTNETRIKITIKIKISSLYLLLTMSFDSDLPIGLTGTEVADLLTFYASIQVLSL